MDLFGQSPVVRCIDMEATALERGEVIEVAHYDFNPATGDITGGWSELCRTAVNPAETRAIHHIRTADVAGCPPYDRRVVYEAAVRAGAVAWAAHNTGLEEQFLPNGLPIVCTYKAALRLWPDAPGNHGLFALLYYLEDEGLATYDQALAWPSHRALPDAYACAVVLAAIYRAGITGKKLLEWTAEPRVLPRCPIGAWRGYRWEEVEWSMLEWIVWKARDLDADIRWNAQREMDRREQSNER